MGIALERIGGIMEIVALELGATKAELGKINGTNVNVNVNYHTSGTPPTGTSEAELRAGRISAFA